MPHSLRGLVLAEKLPTRQEQSPFSKQGKIKFKIFKKLIFQESFLGGSKIMLFGILNGKQYAEQKYNRLVRRLRYSRIIDLLDDHKELLKDVRARYNKMCSMV